MVVHCFSLVFGLRMSKRLVWIEIPPRAFLVAFFYTMNSTQFSPDVPLFSVHSEYCRENTGYQELSEKAGCCMEKTDFKITRE